MLPRKIYKLKFTYRCVVCDSEQQYYVGWGGGYSHIEAILECDAVKVMVFKQFSLGYGIEIR